MTHNNHVLTLQKHNRNHRKKEAWVKKKHLIGKEGGGEEEAVEAMTRHNLMERELLLRKMADLEGK